MIRRSFLAQWSGTRRSRRHSPRESRHNILPVERLESRLAPAANLLSIAAARPEVTGFPDYPALPIPAGATLIDVSDSGKKAVFSSADPNVVAGQQTVPFLKGAVGNLFWMDLSAGLDAPVIRLVTHVAASTQASAGFTGIGTGLVNPFVPGTADLSGDGMSVVFDSPINAHTFDATVPMSNDKPSSAKLAVRLPLGGSMQLVTVEGEGSIDVFVWHATAADPAHNIVAVSLLNASGKQGAVGQSTQWGFPTPDITKPMMAGVFPEQAPLGTPGGFGWSVDGFVVDRAGAGSAGPSRCRAARSRPRNTRTAAFPARSAATRTNFPGGRASCRRRPSIPSTCSSPRPASRRSRPGRGRRRFPAGSRRARPWPRSNSSIHGIMP